MSIILFFIQSLQLLWSASSYLHISCNPLPPPILIVMCKIRCKTALLPREHFSVSWDSVSWQLSSIGTNTLTKNSLQVWMFLTLTVSILKNHRIIYFKGVNFILCELYLNKAVMKKKKTEKWRKKWRQFKKKCPPKFSVFLGKESTWVMRIRRLDYYLSFGY